ncbi:MAG TPA: aminoacyl-tRNA hydrolase [Candidatus Saccharimonadales bacterium]|nr:aminoacyl-tRNA hydrolase [Candidatus Saccharimonadales bacterium]
MAFLQKRPNVGQPTQFYTVGQNKTVLVVGLGNIGREYDGTRHNIGFACVDDFASKNGFDPWIEKKDLKALFTSATLGDSRVILIKPTTLMNLSGQAVQATMAFYKIVPERVIIVHDELDIPFGQIRTRVGGSSAGHNGVKSVTNAIGEQYGRVRVGIGPKTHEQMDSADFVLQRFNAEQMAHISALTREASAILSEYIFGDAQLPHETRSFIV